MGPADVALATSAHTPVALPRTNVRIVPTTPLRLSQSSLKPIAAVADRPALLIVSFAAALYWVGPQFARRALFATPAGTQNSMKQFLIASATPGTLEATGDPAWHVQRGSTRRPMERSRARSAL